MAPSDTSKTIDMLGFEGGIVRSSKDVKRSLLKRAFSQNRGAEVISEILSRVRKVREMASEDQDALRQATKDHDNDTARTVRAFNVVARLEGRDDYLVDEGHRDGPDSSNALDTSDEGHRDAPVLRLVH